MPERSPSAAPARASPTLRALIVDDEPPARDLLRRLLAAHAEIAVIGEARSAVDAAEQCARLRPDVVFLDVQMPREDGFALLPRLTPPLPAIVFVTAYDEFAVRAFDVNAADYLLKPVAPDRLARAIARVAAPPSAPEATPATLPGATRLQASDTLFLRTDQNLQTVPVLSVTHIVAEENYTRVHLADGTAPLLRRTMNEWESLLPTSHFFRIERSLIVNRTSVLRLDVISRDVAHAHVAGRREPLVLARRASLRLRQALEENT
jgi:two-component system, LytTR family, response regulator